MRDDATDLDHIPGDSGPPLINNSLRFLRDAWALEDSHFARFGALARTRLFGRTVILTGSPPLATRLLLDRERVLSSKFAWGHLLGELFPRGLMLRDFDDHRHHRGIMQAAFRTPARAAYHAQIDAHFGETLGAWGAGERRCYPAIKRALLEQAATVFLGLEPGAQVELLSRCFVDMLRATVTLVRVNLPGTAWHRGLVGRRELAGFLRAEIPKRRQATESADLFSLLCRAKDEEGASFDDEAIIDHMIFLLFAAHDTTTVALTTLVDELSRAPALQERAAAECVAVHEGSDAAPSLPWAKLDALPYLDRCFREALRVNPPVPYVLRRTVAACPFGGQQMPARTPITLVIRALHNDPSLWTEPERFDPDRFSPERAEDRSHPHAWVPFGGGAHRCIGAQFARQQATVFAYHLLARYRLERLEPGPTRWRRVPLPRPADDLPIRLVPR